MSAELQNVIDDLTAKVGALKTAADAAEAALIAVPQRIADAVAAAQAAGATPEQLQALTDLAATLNTETGELTAALAAASPAPPADPNP